MGTASDFTLTGVLQAKSPHCQDNKDRNTQSLASEHPTTYITGAAAAHTAAAYITEAAVSYGDIEITYRR